MNAPAAERRRILVVEDDPKLADIVVHKLKQDGHDVRRASNGFEAGLLVRSFRPHVVLMDLMLPGMDGAEVCRQIRADPELTRTRILGMSAASDETALERFRAIVDDFMPKPFKLAEIGPRLEKLFGPPGPDPDGFERNRVVLLSRDSAWTQSARRSLESAGYLVEACSTPEAAGFAAARSGAAAVAVHGVEDRILDSLRKAVRVVEAPPDALPEAVRAAAGKIVRRRTPSGLVPAILASLGILAVTAAVLLWPRGGPADAAEVDPEVEQWRELERRATEGRLVYFTGRYLARESLGEGMTVRLKDRTLEGFLLETPEGATLRTPEGTLALRKDEILERRRTRLAYEEYWDRAAALGAKDAAAHYALAVWCRGQGLADAAVREFRRALVADPAHADSRRELGYSLRGGKWAR